MHHLFSSSSSLWQEVFGIIIAVTCIVTAVLWSAAILIKVIIGRLKRTHSVTVSRRQKCVLFLGGISILCFLYSYLIEPYQLTVDSIKLSSNKIHQPLRIVHITDLHCDGIVRTEKQLPETIQSLRPDLIVFTGDAANNKRGLTQFRECIHQIAAIAPTFAVYGNHDSRGGRNWNFYGGTGVNLLNCESQIMTIKGTKIWIGGVAIDNEICLEKTLDQVPADAYTIFLYHYPAGIESAASHSIDLFCTGHTHGG